MIKEKHTLTNPYNHHALLRYIDVYEVSANRCHSVPESGYKGTEATLVDEPAWNEKFSSYSITGATLTGNNFILNNDVTAQANYETAKDVTTIRCNSTKNSGFIGDTASLSNTAEWNEKFSSYSITGSTLTGSDFSFTGSDITAQANFETAKNIDTINCIANPNSGFIGDTGSLSVNLAWNEKLNSYDVTGTVLTGSDFSFTGSDITAEANIETAKNVTIQPTIHGTISSDKMSGFSGDVATITTVPDDGYILDTLDIIGSTLTANNFMFLNSNINIAGSFVDKYNPLNLPSNTIRVKFKNGYTPTMGDTQTLVDSQNNIWDIYKASNYWYGLFNSNSALTDILGANTTNVTALPNAFVSCKALTSVSLFDLSNADDISHLFEDCQTLTTIPEFDVRKATKMNSIFSTCYKLTAGALLNTSAITSIGFSYYDCSSLKYVPLLNTTNVKYAYGTFFGCSNVISGALALYKQMTAQTNPPTAHTYTFYNCGINTTQGAAELAQIPSDWK